MLLQGLHSCPEAVLLRRSRTQPLHILREVTDSELSFVKLCLLLIKFLLKLLKLLQLLLLLCLGSSSLRVVDVGTIYWLALVVFLLVLFALVAFCGPPAALVRLLLILLFLSFQFTSTCASSILTLACMLLIGVVPLPSRISTSLQGLGAWRVAIALHARPIATLEILLLIVLG